MILTLPRWLIVIAIVLVLVLVVGILSWAIVSFSVKSLHHEATSNNETSSVINEDEEVAVGHVIIKDASIYFIYEKDLPDGDIENIQWHERSSFMGHPSDYVLFGKPVEAIMGELTTGDKVEIWYSVILESHPAQIKVLKIRKL